jgi:hypothetical protein
MKTVVDSYSGKTGFELAGKLVNIGANVQTAKKENASGEKPQYRVGTVEYSTPKGNGVCNVAISTKVDVPVGDVTLFYDPSTGYAKIQLQGFIKMDASLFELEEVEVKAD